MTILNPKGFARLDEKEAVRPSTSRDDANLDQSSWNDLSELTDAGRFGRAWLTLASRSFDKLHRAALLIGPAESGPFEPVARWSRYPEQDEVVPFVAGLDAVLAAALKRRQPAIEGLSRDADSAEKHLFIGYPLLFAGALHGVVVAESEALDQVGAKRLLRHLQWSSGWIESFLTRSLRDTSVLLAERAVLIAHTIEAVVSKPHLVDAARVLAGLIERRFECDQVAVGRFVRRRTRLIAVSQTAVFERRSIHARLFGAAADEAIDQGTTLVASGSEDLPFVTLAQAALRRATGDANILTVPLVSGGEAFGAIILIRSKRMFGQSEIDLVDALGVSTAAVLAEKARTDRPLALLALGKLGVFAGKLFGARHLALKLGVIAVIVAAVFLSVAKQDYRIRARAEVQGEVRRSLSAPFDGYIRSAHARAGDLVPGGAVLAELQDNELILDRLRNLSPKRQYQAEVDKSLAKGDLAGTNIARAQVAQADADIELSDQMLARAQVKAPFAAVIVAGDLSQSIGRPVSRGDQLFELAPLDQYRVTLVVPDSDVRLVQPGMQGEILLSALPDEPFPFEIKSLTPVARTSEGVNGFEASGSLTNKDQRIRPGMEGIAKIAAGERSLVWIWTHPFIEWARIKLWGIIP